MKKYYKDIALVALVLSLLFIGCKKTANEFSGTSSTAAFDFLQVPANDTLPYAYSVNFTNKSTEEFLYQWSFGDNSALSSTKDPMHTFVTGGIYNVTLTTVGTNGNSSVTKVVGVADACANDFYTKLTDCASKEWTWSSDADAIKVLSPDATAVYFSGGVSGCQADDIYIFSKEGKFTYNANGETFDVQAGYSCQPARANAASFKVIAKASQLPVIVLDSLPSGAKPFIGTTDVVAGNKYQVMNYTATTMVLRSVLPDGALLEVKMKKVVTLSLDDIKSFLTGGTARSWKLDDTAGANPIVVGTEANPAQYFAGGAIEACQADDVYTFTAANKLAYNSNGATFNGGNIAPNYTCGNDRSYTNVDYTFSATTGGVAGLGTIKMPLYPATIFLGVTDEPRENNYRIIEISNTKMILRAGNGSGTVFQFKFLAL